jgi:hypothetical protein
MWSRTEVEKAYLPPKATMPESAALSGKKREVLSDEQERKF